MGAGGGAGLGSSWSQRARAHPATNKHNNQEPANPESDSSGDCLCALSDLIFCDKNNSVPDAGMGYADGGG